MNLILSFVACLLISNTNVVVVLDASGSMSNILATGESRMDAAKVSLCQTIDNLKEDTNLGVCVFSSWNTPDWVHPISKINDKQQLKNLINSIQETGGTPLGLYIKIGADQLLAKRNEDKNGIYKLILITDGEANDQNLVDKYLPDVMNRGIVVNVIGIGMHSSHSLAKRVHKYVDVNDAESLKKAINDALGEVNFDSSSNDDYFEIIQSLDTPTSLEILNNFSKVYNHPIGEQVSVGQQAEAPKLIKNDVQNQQINKSSFAFYLILTICSVVAILFIIFLLIRISE